MQGNDGGTVNETLRELHRTADMKSAMLLEESFADATLGLDVSADNPHGYPINI